MRILWITENYYPNRGGMAQSCDRIVANVRELDTYIDVLHLAKKCRRRPNGNPISGQDICWPLEDSPAHGLNLLWNWIEARNEKYTLVLAYGTHYALIAARNYACWLNLPLITMVRGNDFDSAVFDYRRRSLIEDVYRASAKVICVSQDKATKIQALYPSVDTTWVANGIDLKQWRALTSFKKSASDIKLNLPQDRKVIGLIGDLKAKKGGEFFLETLRVSGLNQQVHLLLVGNLDEKIALFLQEYQALISYTHIAFTERHQLIPYYLSCDCIAIPSFYDGMPNVLLEAAGLAIPLIAANTGGMKDILCHRENALLFPPGDTHALREQIEFITYATADTLLSLGQNAQKLVQQHYTHTHEALAYKELFQVYDN